MPVVKRAPPYFKDWHGPKKQTGEQRNQQREKQNWPVNSDFVDAWQARRRDTDQHAKRSVGQGQAQSAAEQSQDYALQQQLAGDASPAGAQSSAQRQLLPSSFHPDEQKVRDICAGNQQHHANRAHENPQNAAHVAHYILFQRSDVRRDSRIFE